MFTFGMAQLKKRVHVHQAHAKEEEEEGQGGMHGLFVGHLLLLVNFRR